MTPLLALLGTRSARISVTLAASFFLSSCGVSSAEPPVLSGDPLVIGSSDQCTSAQPTWIMPAESTLSSSDADGEIPAMTGAGLRVIGSDTLQGTWSLAFGTSAVPPVLSESWVIAIYPSAKGDPTQAVSLLLTFEGPGSSLPEGWTARSETYSRNGPSVTYPTPDSGETQLTVELTNPAFAKVRMPFYWSAFAFVTQDAPDGQPGPLNGLQDFCSEGNKPILFSGTGAGLSPTSTSDDTQGVSSQGRSSHGVSSDNVRL